jgi:electron transfer flavoprotein alpha/beta subunit
MAAKRKPLVLKPVSLDTGGIEVLAMLPPPERKEGRIVGEGAGAVAELVRLLREEAKVL